MAIAWQKYMRMCDEAYVFFFFEQTVSDGELPVGLPHGARTHGAVSFISLNMASIHNTNDQLLPASHLEAEITSCMCKMNDLSFTWDQFRN